MKFNLSNFLQLDTKGLLAVNGGFTCGGSSNSPSESSTSESTGNSNGGSTTTVFIPTGPCNGYLSTKHSKGNGFSDKTGHGSSSGSSGGGSCSTPSSSPDSSSGKSNNPDGQGPSTTSSNPGGNQHKDTKIHSGGGTCTKTGGHSPVNPNPTNPDDVTSGGGTCSSKNDTDKVSGMFGQITDGSYADKLTMQKYSKEPYKYHPHLDEKMNGSGNTFSHQGCKMTAAAKVASEITGKEIDMFCDINQIWDSDKNGLLTREEIATGLNNLLDETFGDIFNVQTESKKNISIDNLKNISNKNKDIGATFVLAKVNLGDVNNDGIADEHWIVLEGYSQDSTGKISFTYDGTSDNDSGRTYVLGGQPNPASRIGTVVELQTFTLTRN